MKNIFLLLLALALFAFIGCRRSDEKSTAQPQSTPDAARLKSESERLQQATANAAKAKANENQSTPSPTVSP